MGYVIICDDKDIRFIYHIWQNEHSNMAIHSVPTFHGRHQALRIFSEVVSFRRSVQRSFPLHLLVFFCIARTFPVILAHC